MHWPIPSLVSLVRFQQDDRIDATLLMTQGLKT